ncbi:MAG: M18 family aminopeptidase [Clostridia bacterium]
MDFTQFVSSSYTSYHAVANVAKYLEEKGFIELNESDTFSLVKGGRYFVIRDGSALAAFVVGENSYNIVACHTDSPSFKIKGNPLIKDALYVKLNTESYGGGLYYSFLDRPLKLAGRAILLNRKTGEIQSKLVKSDFNVIIPSLAIHMNREANKSLALNPQIDMLPLVSTDGDVDVLKAVVGEIPTDFEMIESDIYVTPNVEPFESGIKNEFLSSPRLDDLCGVYGAIEALIRCSCNSTAIAVCFDNEEVGSSTKQGAGGTFLKHLISRISTSMGVNDQLKNGLNSSFMVSMDNAHAVHPNHAEKNDPTNKPTMNGGVVIKHHANQNYTSDAVSSAVIKYIFSKANVKYQDFYMRSDMACGGTLGAISSGQLSIRSVDIGLAQLAMHSAVETMGASDIDTLVCGLTAFYNSKINTINYDKISII